MCEWDTPTHWAVSSAVRHHMEDGQTITLGIPCYQEEAQMAETLSVVSNFADSLARVIVVDDGSTDRTLEIAQGFPFVDALSHDENRGRGAARNTILSATSTPLLASIDADIRPREGWLSALRETMADTGAAAVGGNVVIPGESPADRWRRTRLRVNDFETRGQVSYLAGGNALFDVAALRAVDGWPALQSTEDRRVSARLREAGYSLYYTPEAVVDHVGEATPKSVLRNLWRWHFESRNEPQSLLDVSLRTANHAGKGAYYVAEDVLRRRWWAIPITARLPIEFTREDLDRLE